MKIVMKKIGYPFKNPQILEIALTHRSVNATNNERMEFLGDAVLSFVIAAQLFQQFPHADEGTLSRLRANLVNEAVLAEIAQEFTLGEHIRLGSGEMKSGGARRKSILADTLEAIIGAIYLDADIVACQKIILTWFKERIDQADKVDNLKDAKSLLQEYLQAKKMPLPVYELISVTGEAHSQHFHVSCEVEGLAHRTEGVGSTQRGAQQMAAEIFLKWVQS